MNQNFFNFPTSWVAEMNKQAQPKQVELPPQLVRQQEDIKALEYRGDIFAKERVPPSFMAWPELKEAPTHAKRKGRPAGSKNKPKAK